MDFFRYPKIIRYRIVLESPPFSAQPRSMRTAVSDAALGLDPVAAVATSKTAVGPADKRRAGFHLSLS